MLSAVFLVDNGVSLSPHGYTPNRIPFMQNCCLDKLSAKGVINEFVRLLWFMDIFVYVLLFDPHDFLPWAALRWTEVVNCCISHSWSQWSTWKSGIDKTAQDWLYSCKVLNRSVACKSDTLDSRSTFMINIVAPSISWISLLTSLYIKCSWL